MLKELPEGWFYINPNGGFLKKPLDYGEKHLKECQKSGERCCEEIAEIIGKAIKKFIKKEWNYTDRKPTWYEVSKAWGRARREDEHQRMWWPFVEEARKLRLRIKDFYLVKAKRCPTSREVECAYVESTKHFWSELSPYIVLGDCFYCGKMVLAYDSGDYCCVGELNMSFGYGSRLDTTYTKNYIHDVCAVHLARKFKGRVLFKSALSADHTDVSDKILNKILAEQKEAECKYIRVNKRLYFKWLKMKKRDALHRKLYPEDKVIF